jgi:hypothetical protein
VSQQFPIAPVAGTSSAATGNAEPETRSSTGTKLSKDQPPQVDEGFDRAQRLASGRVEADDVAWLSKGFRAFLERAAHCRSNGASACRETILRCAARVATIGYGARGKHWTKVFRRGNGRSSSRQW